MKVTGYRLKVTAEGHTPYHFLNAKSGKGFSTLELMIAMAILVLSLGAVVLVSFSNQSILVDSQLSAEALTKAQESLEAAQALARKDFKLVNPIAATADGMYTKTIDIEDGTDYFSKKITATIEWEGEHLRDQHTVLTSIVSDFENPVGADTCSSILTGDWTDPDVQNGTTDFADLIGDSAGTYLVGDIDVYLKKLYVAVSNTGVAGSNTFFALDVSNPSNPTVMAQKSIDNDPASVIGLNGLAVASRYAFVASGRSANFNTTTPTTPCDNAAGTNKSCGQFQVIDLGATDSANASLVYTLEMPAVGHGGSAVGQAVYYKDGFVYLGLSKTDSGDEFNIIDVHSPTVPIRIGGLPVGSGVNSIIVRNTAYGTFAYVASPNNTMSGNANGDEISVINVSNPASPTYVTGFAGENDEGNGKSMYAIGDDLYVGETASGSSEEFFKLDNANPNLLASKNPYPLTNASLFSKEIGSSVNGLIVRNYLAFIGTTGGEFQVWNIANPASVALYDTSSISLSGSAASLDCEGNNVYAASNQSRGYLYSIAP